MDRYYEENDNTYDENFYEEAAGLLNTQLRKIQSMKLEDKELSILVIQANLSAKYLDFIHQTNADIVGNLTRGEYKRLSDIALKWIDLTNIRNKVNSKVSLSEKYEFIIKLLDANQTGGGRNRKSRRSKQKRKKQTKRRKYNK